ncbi:hypothetical protein N799_02490 [Lysobacter arseniciresistens ZS79]|uniref:DUF3592 domain-containing protein n=1 Tax=Lysobacter arseniciresistens ZS79 TaxID=913325 RepID=A0A0A0F0S5_9GAMM|nr:DUF3592 domain-containing protein [Lysobacter arseniciresistens]KGM56776.1 hypothetical protein N799_02490 [Lysobacter arseniciresistens ZS79]
MAGSRGLRAMAWGWLLIGALASALGALLLAAAGLFVSSSTAAIGEVVDHHGAINGNGPRKRGRFDPKLVAVVEYRDREGGLHRFAGNIAQSESDLPAVGERIPVRYQRLADGTVAQRIDDAGEIWGLPAGFALFGLGFLGAGALGHRAAARGAGMPHAAVIPRGLHRDPAAAARVLAKLRRRRR